MTPPTEETARPPSRHTPPDASTVAESPSQTAPERARNHRDGPSNARSRRGFLGALAAGAGLLAGCSDGAGDGTRVPTGNPGGGDDGTSRRQTGESWLADVDNYDGYVNRLGEPLVTVQVGAPGNGGHNAFEPAAVMVSSGSRVRWSWTGDGGAHGVAERNGQFESEVTATADHIYEQPFTGSTVYRYYCPEHRSVGMKGVVLVR